MKIPRRQFLQNLAEELEMPFVKSSTMLHTTEEADAGADQHFQQPQHKTAKSKTTLKRTVMLADATNAKNPFVENALPVHNVCAQAANKILALLPYKIDWRLAVIYHMFN